MSTENEKARLHAIIDGSVQGVGFRMFVMNHAYDLGIFGWVRNTFDGKVEVTAEGPKKDLEKLLEKLRLGPRSAFVTQVQQEWLPANDEFSRFDIRHTI